jgi:hypothetical protein
MKQKSKSNPDVTENQKEDGPGSPDQEEFLAKRREQNFKTKRLLSVPLTGLECSGHETGYSRGKQRREGKVNRGVLRGGWRGKEE